MALGARTADGEPDGAAGFDKPWIAATQEAPRLGGVGRRCEAGCVSGRMCQVFFFVSGACSVCVRSRGKRYREFRCRGVPPFLGALVLSSCSKHCFVVAKDIGADLLCYAVKHRGLCCDYERSISSTTPSKRTVMVYDLRQQ